ncbi:MAG: hypothetical protein GXY83_06660 [Rhodopirellula sp.]|nr:hypothetical protein [Rhodopirellula sp.]
MTATCIEALALYRPRDPQRLLGRDDVVPGMIGAIQTFGELLHFHPHMHTLVTCGAFTREGEFLEVPELDKERLLAAWQEAVFALYLAEGKIEAEVVENMRSWPHSGFSVDQSVFLAAHRPNAIGSAAASNLGGGRCTCVDLAHSQQRQHFLEFGRERSVALASPDDAGTPHRPASIGQVLRRNQRLS